MKTNLCSLLMGLALFAINHSAFAQPALGIIQTNNQSLLYWPANATGFILQSTTNLSPANWTLATDAITTTYGSNTAVTVANSSSQRFFRLFQNITTTPDGMALIPAGSFTMGDVSDGGTAPISVFVSAFYMDTNLVNYSQWTSNYNFAVSHGYTFDHAGIGKAPDHPVVIINWYDAVKWCNARSQQAGLTPVYFTDAAMTLIYTNGDTDTVYANWANSGYRLPTEAEWEKAARGGLSGFRFPWGNTISESQADYIGNTNFPYDLGPTGYNTNFDTGSPPFTSPVGSFPPNGYGLFDMAGNAYEWCWDWAGSYLGGSDPRGPATGSSRILRGGDWDDTANDAATAVRSSIGPSSALSYWGFRCVRNIPNTTTADGMALIPAGSFTIGDTLDGESDAIPTNVNVSAFYIDTNLVSYGQWKLVYNYATSHGYGFDDAGYAKATNHPAGNVNWYDAVKWCNARSQQAGLTPVYYTDVGFTQVYTNGDIDITNANVNWSANGYRLPTSAEWEKAARGGLTGQRFPWGLTISESQANYQGNTNNFYDLGPEGSNTNYNTGYPYTSPVGAFAANGYGLYDMAGNMNEWCWDWYAVPSYPAGSPYLGGTDPRGPVTESVYYRVARGGGWSNEGAELRCAFPNGFPPNAIANGIIGLRCVRNLPTTTTDGMALIPAGSFTIGDTLDGESDALPTNVYVSAFYMDTNLVSYGQWNVVYNYATNHDYGFDAAGTGKADNQPVYYVSWYDCVKWCNARSQQAGLTPVYYTDAGMTQVYTNGEIDALYPNWSANGYRLPTEAEWEKAARGGLSGQRFPWGLTISESQANYSGDTEDYSYDLGPDGANTNFNQTGYPYTSPVGYFAPNGYGLYDMAGNLFEWCWDWYATPPYPAGSPYLGGTDPRGPATGGAFNARVQRTGAWNNAPSYQRCCNRAAFYPNYGNGSFGFRSVRNF